MKIKIKDLVKRNKFGAKKTEYNGKVYASRKESEFARHLEYLKHAHDPKERVVVVIDQFPMPVYIKHKHVFTYICDFKVQFSDGRWEYIDVKGMKKGSAWAIFRIKQKCVEAEYGIEIKIV